MDDIKFKVNVKELDGSIQSSEVTVDENNEVSYENSDVPSPLQEINYIDLYVDFSATSANEHIQEELQLTEEQLAKVIAQDKYCILRIHDGDGFIYEFGRSYKADDDYIYFEKEFDYGFLRIDFDPTSGAGSLYFNPSPNLIIISSTSGELTEDEFTTLLEEGAYIFYGGKYFYKLDNDSNMITFQSGAYLDGEDDELVSVDEIYVIKPTRKYSVSKQSWPSRDTGLRLYYHEITFEYVSGTGDVTFGLPFYVISPQREAFDVGDALSILNGKLINACDDGNSAIITSLESDADDDSIRAFNALGETYKWETISDITDIVSEITNED